MILRSAMTALALVSALTFSGAAFAQNAIGGVTIPEGNLKEFQEKCAAINSAANDSLAEKADAGNDDATATGSTSDTDTPSGDSADPASEDNIATLLAGLTPEQCKEAGF